MAQITDREIIEIIKIKCNDCNEYFLESKLTYIKFDGDEIALCNECSDNYKKCSDCNLYFESGEMKWHNDNYYCEECFDESYEICQHCDEIVDKDEIKYSESRNESLCEHCYNRLIISCYNCECEIDRENENYNEVEGDTYCQRCLENYCYYCERCEEYHRENHVCNNSCIHDYSYKPPPKFFKVKNEKLFLGIEVEVEGDNSYAESFEGNKYFYCKRDSSLNDGFEIVSHPISYEYMLKNKDIFKTIFNLAQKGCNSYNTATCGIHIHISKDALSIFDRYKLLKFFLNNWNYIKIISQRKTEQLNQWGGLDYSSSNECLKITKFGNSRRYVCLNFMNRNTIECRIFRGTLNPKSFFKNIEFIISLIEFIKITSHSSLTWDNYKIFVLINHYKNLINFFEKKGL